MRPSRRVASLLFAGLLAGCSGSSGGSPAAPPSPTESPSPAVALPPGSVLVLDPAVPLTKTYATTEFTPSLSLRLPADWTTAERDEAAFQMYVGDEDYEITFDRSSTRKESVADAIARLKRTEGIQAGPVTPVTMGGRQGLAFVAIRKGPLRLQFTDSGFHVPGDSDMEAMAVPLADGSTLTVFVTRRVDGGVTRPLEAIRRLARRVLATVTWR